MEKDLIYLRVENGSQVKQLKLQLEHLKLFNKQCKIQKQGSHFLVYTLTGSLDDLISISVPYLDTGYYHQVHKDSSDLRNTVLEFYNVATLSPSPNETLLSQVPKKWSLYPPMLLLQTGTFDTTEWEDEFAKLDSVLKNKFWQYLLSKNFPGITHVAINKPIIESDVQRRPFNIFPLYGDFGPQVPFESEPTANDLQQAFWCTVVQNGIHQTWAPKYTMFSRGNIKEKKRLLDSYKDLNGQTVLDLYAGIGYFTLSYLKNGATVFCWELNPWSVEALVRGCNKNKFGVRVIEKDEIFSKKVYNELLKNGVKAFIFNESNETAISRMNQLGEQVPLSHVNLGLLPSSKPSWPLVVDLIHKHSTERKTLVHIHENCHIQEFEKLKVEIENCFATSQFIHLEQVKTFAPDIWHVVIDIEVAK